MPNEKRDAKKSGQIKESGLTYEDYAQLPDEGPRYELVDGQLELLSSPARAHQVVSRQLSHLLSLDCSSEYEIVTAPVDVVLSPAEVRQPDVIMIHLSRISIYKEQGCIEAPPDLVVEILSPSSLNRDKVAKRMAYAKFGVPEYWIINPTDETLEQHLLTQPDTYELVNVYFGADPIQSKKLTCISFSMDDVMSRVRNLPNT